MNTNRLIACLALMIFVLSLLRDPETPRGEATNVLPFKREPAA